MQFDDMNTPIPESDISMDEDWPILPSATISCPTVSEPAPNDRISQKSPNERQRPARTVNRPPRYRDNSFETHFQPVPRRHCRNIQKQKLTGHNNINVGGYLDLGRGENNRNVIPTGNENTRQKQYLRLETSRHPDFIANSHPDPTRDLLATSRSLENNRRRYLRGNKGRIKSATPKTKKVPSKRYRHVRNVQELHTSNSSRQHDHEHRPIIGPPRREAARPLK